MLQPVRVRETRSTLSARHHPRRVRRPMVIMSLLLHAALLVAWLALAPPPPEPADLAPDAVDVVMEGGPTESEAAPTTLPPTAPTPVPVEPPPTEPAPIAPTTATPAVPTPMPAPTPAVRLPDEAAEPARIPEFRPPVPPALPVPTRPTPAPRALPRPPSRPAPRSNDFALFEPPVPHRQSRQGSGALDLSLGASLRDDPGAPPRANSEQDANIRVRGAQVGPDWIALLHEWWVRHSAYPSQAAANGEDGTVQIHLVVDRDGKVEMVELVSRSGSQWLDMGALATFRGRTLPPFPPQTPEPRGDVDLTINYVLLGR